MRAADPNLPPVSPKVLTAKTLGNYLTEYFPESSNAASTQAVRREEARFDPYNPVSFAATLKAILDGDHIPNNLIFNSDQTSMKIGQDPVTKVFMVAGTKEKLKSNNLNPGVTRDTESTRQMRSIQVMVTTSAIGKLNSVIISIKDNKAIQVHSIEVVYFLKRIDSEMAAEKMRLKKTTEGRMTVAQLKENLRASNLSSRGTKDELIRRLMEHNMQAQREEELVLLP